MDLLNFLAQAAGVAPGVVPEDDQVPEDPNNPSTITVTGTKPNNDPEVFNMTPDPRIWRQPEKPQGAEFGMELGSGRKSPLGVGGKLRDILGGLGDALLVGTGEKAIYAPKRQEEKMQDAMQIFQQKPEAGLRAINSIDTKRAYDMQQDAIGNQIKRDDLSRKSRSDDIRIMADGLKAWGVIGQTANAITDQASYDRMKPILQNFATKYDIPLELPPVYDKAAIEGLVQGQMGRWRERRLEQMGQNLDSLIDYREGMLGQGQQRLSQGQQRLGLQGRSVAVQEARETRQAQEDPLGTVPTTTAQTYERTATFQGKQYGLPKGKDGSKRSNWVELPNQ